MYQWKPTTSVFRYPTELVSLTAYQIHTITLQLHLINCSNSGNILGVKSQDPTNLGTEGKAKKDAEKRSWERGHGETREEDSSLVGRRKKTQATDLEMQRALIFLQKKQEHPRVQWRSEELQEIFLVEMLWRDISCPPYTWWPLTTQWPLPKCLYFVKVCSQRKLVGGRWCVLQEDTLKPIGHLTFTQHLLHELKLRSRIYRMGLSFQQIVRPNANPTQCNWMFCFSKT